MSKIYHTVLKAFKNSRSMDILFYIFFFVAVVVSLTMSQSYLMYILPLVIGSIILKYLSYKDITVSKLFLFAALLLIISDVLSLQDFFNNFIWIAILTSTYLICLILILRKYLSSAKIKSLLSVSLIIGVLLVTYILYAVLELLINNISNHLFIYTVLVALCLFLYAITFAMIYISDKYTNGPVLLASGVFNIFQMTLSSINEFFFYNRAFTVVIVICHILSIYLFMKFIAEAKVASINDMDETF